jgi:pyridoxamine 5'-phosphate oxidase
MPPSLAELRREYTRSGLNESDLLPDPIAQFQRWFDDALQAGLAEPNAMTLATVGADGQPSARILLLKGVDAAGFRFFTNYEGQKARELEASPRAAMVCFWAELERQVRVTGTCSKLSREESESYFRTRPRGSRLAAWISRQSSVIAARSVIEEEMKRIEAEHPGEDIPLPPNWGGYVLAPQTVEFWQGRPSRLHDRLRYSRATDGAWKIERLAP